MLMVSEEPTGAAETARPPQCYGAWIALSVSMESFRLKVPPVDPICRRDNEKLLVIAANISADILRAASNYDPFVTDKRPLTTKWRGPRA